MNLNRKPAAILAAVAPSREQSKDTPLLYRQKLGQSRHLAF